MEHTEFGGGDRPESLEHVQREVDRAFPGLEADEEPDASFADVAEDTPDHDSVEPGGIIDLKKVA